MSVIDTSNTQGGREMSGQDSKHWHCAACGTSIPHSGKCVSCAMYCPPTTTAMMLDLFAGIAEDDSALRSLAMMFYEDTGFRGVVRSAILLEAPLHIASVEIPTRSNPAKLSALLRSKARSALLELRRLIDARLEALNV